jgi:hypothetical protein
MGKLKIKEIKPPLQHIGDKKPSSFKIPTLKITVL